MNTIEVNIHLSPLYKYERGALQAATDMCPYITTQFDRREPLGKLKNVICEVMKTYLMISWYRNLL